MPSTPFVFSVRTGERAGQDSRPSEDRVFVTPAGDAVVVLDGVSTLSDERPRGGWYADTLGALLVDGLTAAPRAELTEVLHDALAAVTHAYGLVPGASPAATVSIVRLRGRVVEAAVLGDSPVAVVGRDGTARVFTDPRLATLVESRPQAAEYRRRLAGGSGFDERHRELLRELRDAQMGWINRPGGYWVAEAVPEAGRRALTASWPLDEVAQVLAATDGVSAAVDDYRLHSWEELAAACRADHPQAVVDGVHRAEERDPDGRTWPRNKPHDDKALAEIAVHPVGAGS
ncbi:protein phosphatase 2C domain-containing protein [Kitasatospora sp. NPDC089913]|uniref:protein phosphatase 2C domain-containing protein n=1 Tax=Streptomycetaceae TaxID=2062 RepID=UPI00087A6359|nr:protein phosphatase 2C domain-containing protein [Streptomyces sp. TLI_053]SDT81883.1 Protein phosphatase 2C [Streptomyces sp. TLI_053]